MFACRCPCGMSLALCNSSHLIPRRVKVAIVDHLRRHHRADHDHHNTKKGPFPFSFLSHYLFITCSSSLLPISLSNYHGLYWQTGVRCDNHLAQIPPNAPSMSPSNTSKIIFRDNPTVEGGPETRCRRPTLRMAMSFPTIPFSYAPPDYLPPRLSRASILGSPAVHFDIDWR